MGIDLTQEQMIRMQENRAAALAKRQKRGSEPLCSVFPSGSSGEQKIQLLAPIPDGFIPAGKRSGASSDASSSGNPQSTKLSIMTNLQPSFGSRQEDAVNSKKRQGSVPDGSGADDETPAARHHLEVELELISTHHFTVNWSCVGGNRRLEGECVRELAKKLSSMHSSNLLSNSLQVVWFDVEHYDHVVKVVNKLPGVSIKPIPLPTRVALNLLGKRVQRSNTANSDPYSVPSEVIEKQLLSLPPKLKESLLPFQWEGVRYGLRRSGRCLIADEMGVGKTIQAIGIAACYKDEGSILIICPASMRLPWAEELERWLPFLAPKDVHLVFGRKNDLVEQEEVPKFVVISYTMLKRLVSSFSSHKWAMVIVDESHNLRTTRRKDEREETMAVLNIVRGCKRAVLLSGTPSLSRPFDIFNQVDCLRPGLLGKSKYEFARHYCAVKHGFQNCKDYSKGVRLGELNILLRETIMVRRLKDDVMSQLPPKRRQIIMLKLDKGDIKAARESLVSLHQVVVPGGVSLCPCGFTERGFCDCEEDVHKENRAELEFHEDDSEEQESCRRLSYQEIGLAKLKGVRGWLLNNPIFICSSTDMNNPEDQGSVMKMVIFCHHRAVLDGIQETVVSKGVGFVRVDGTTPPLDRQKAVDLFQMKAEINVAIISVTAGGVGLNFSAAQTVVFAELPKSASEMLQAEDRAHRRGQQNAVNVYIFCANGTADDTQWQSLSKSLERVSTMTNGTSAAIPGLEVDSICDGRRSPGSEKAVHPAQPCECASPLTDIFQGAEDKSRTNNELEDPGRNISTFPAGDHVPRLQQERHSSPQDERGDHQHDTGRITGQEGQASAFDADSLMFEMSSHSGRVHLFSCLPEHSFTPKLLQENFKPEDLERHRTGGQVDRGTLPLCILSNGAFQDAAVSFIAEWHALRPVHRYQLLGRPLRLPLSVELEYLRTQSTYAPGGLVKGGSKRRLVPRGEVISCVPEGATLKTIAFQRLSGSKQAQTLQAWSAEGVPLCKLCQAPCRGKNSRTPEVFAHLFCKRRCFESYCERTNPRYLRQELFQLERGVCAECGLDCHDLVRCLISLPVTHRPAFILKKAPGFSKHTVLLDKLVGKPTEGNAWHADHIIPVFEGGGECSIENLRTLCVVCHAKVTSDQSCRRHSLQRRIQEGLKLTITKLLEREGNAVEVPDGNHDDDDELMVQVAGSSYTEDAISFAECETSTVCVEERYLRTERHQPPAAVEVIEAQQSSKDKSSEDELVVGILGSAYSEGNACRDETAASISGTEGQNLRSEPEYSTTDPVGGLLNSSALEHRLAVSSTCFEGLRHGRRRDRQWQLGRHSAEHKSFSERMLASSAGDAFLEAYFSRRLRKDKGGSE